MSQARAAEPEGPPSGPVLGLREKIGYGFGDYGESARAAPEDDRRMCQHAKERGVSTVLVASAPGAFRLVPCADPERGTPAAR